MTVYVQRRFSMLIGLALLISSVPLQAADNVDKLSEQLIKLRGEVDDLTTELNLSREEHKQRMKYLYVQQSDLKAQQAHDIASIERLQKKLAEHQQQVSEFGADSSQLKPVLLKNIDSIEDYIRRGIPYKITERLSALEELKTQLNSNVIAGQTAANRLWAIVEDEISLTKENGLFRQIVTINNEEYLSSIVRVGMMLMYFKTNDGIYGKADKKAGEWRYVVLNNSRDQDDIDRLIDAYKKQIRTGYFELPSASIL